MRERSARANPYLRESCMSMSTPLAWPLVKSAPCPVSRYSPNLPERVSAWRSIFSTGKSKVWLASSDPAMDWNHSAVEPGAMRSTSDWMSTCASTQCGSVSCRLKARTTC